MQPEELAKALGRLEEGMETLKRNTEEIPTIATGLALVKSDVDDMKPRVKKHEKMFNIGSGVFLVISTLLALFEELR